jgi:hypothetical protein
MLQKLYFPQLKDAMQALTAAALPLVTHCLEQRKEQMRDREAWMATYDQTVYFNLYTTYRGVFLNAVHEAGKLADHYSSI